MTPNQVILDRIQRHALPAVAALESAQPLPLASGGFALRGRVYGDPTSRFPDGTLISTSAVQSMHIDSGSLLPVFRMQSGNFYRVSSWRLA